MVESIRTLLCYLPVHFCKLGKFDGVIPFQDVTISPTKHFTEKENNKDADFIIACFKLVWLRGISQWGYHKMIQGFFGCLSPKSCVINDGFPFAGQSRGECPAQRKTIYCKSNARLEQVPPRQFAVSFVRHFITSNLSRYSNRQPSYRPWKLRFKLLPHKLFGQFVGHW